MQKDSFVFLDLSNMTEHSVILLLSSDDEEVRQFDNPLSSLPAFKDLSAGAPATASFNCVDEFEFDEFPIDRPRKKTKRSPLRSVSGNQKGRTSSKNAVTKHVSSKVKTIFNDRSGTLEEEDAITFTSSGHRSSREAETTSFSPRQTKQGVFSIEDDSDILPEDLADSLISGSRLNSTLSNKTASLLASLPQSSKIPGKKSQRSHKNTKVPQRRALKACTPEIEEFSSEDENVKNNTVANKAPNQIRLTEEEKARRRQEKESERVSKALAREEAKEQRAKTKEEETERKRLSREEKAKEKRALAALEEVNRSSLNREDSIQDMIVDLPVSLVGQDLDMVIRDMMKIHKVETSTYQSPISNMIKWRRKVKARWNSMLERWELLPSLQIEPDKHVLCLMSAKELVASISGEAQEDLDTHVAKVKGSEKDCRPIYLIEGLDEWMRKNKNAINRQYQTKVLAQVMPGEEAAPTQVKRKRKAGHQIIDEDLVEDALLRLQVENGCLVHHTNKLPETAEWIKNFTEHISTIPHR